MTHVEDAAPWYDALDRVVARSRADFVPYDAYVDPEAPDGIAAGFFANYRAADETTLLARRDDTVVGFLTLDVRPDRTDVPVSRPFTYLSLMAVDPAHRGEGVGTALVRAALERRRAGETTRRLALGTWASNEGQLRLFGRFGFEEGVRKPEHRANGDDTVYLVLPPAATPLAE